MDSKNFKVLPTTLEGIDFNKLKIVIVKNWIWILLILILINLTAYLYIRYTKNIYYSESVIKLDLKTEASTLGIKSFIDDPGTNLISGEIEVIQSKLFLSRVLDSAHFEISCYSIGRVLNTDLFNSPPLFIRFFIKDNSIFDTPIYFDILSGNRFNLKIGENGSETSGEFGKRISFKQADFILTKNKAFKSGGEIGYFFIVNSKEKLLDNLSRNLSAEPLNFNAHTILVSLKDNNPMRAKVLLDKIDTLYLQYSNEQKNLANKQKIDWLTNELNQIERKMEGFENYFENFTLQNKTNNLEEDLAKTVLTINKIDTQRFALTHKINDVNQVTDAINSETLLLHPAHRYALPDYLTKNLDDIQLLYAEQERLKLSYNETTFAYRQREKTIESIRNKVLSELQELKTNALLELNELNKKKKELENEFASMPDKNTQLSKNKRFYKLYEEFYLLMMKSKSEFEIAQAGSTPDFKILSSATLPSSPILPNKAMIAGIGLMLSIVISLFFIGILYLLNNKITNANELERFAEVPILGVIPFSRYPNNRTLHVVEHSKSMVSEAIRTVRTNLDFFGTGSVKKIIAISSTVSGEGKSFIALNLGAMIALSKKKVILLDLDMRKAKTKLPIEITDHSKGISTILISKNSWDECLAKTNLPGFDYISSGPHPPNPSELLLNGAFSNLLQELKRNYDFIILDTPPVGLVTDGIMAMKHADISIYVMRANYSKKKFLLNLKRIITINKFSNITTLLNAMPSSSEKGYGYGYYEKEQIPNWFTSIFKKS